MPWYLVTQVLVTYAIITTLQMSLPHIKVKCGIHDLEETRVKIQINSEYLHYQIHKQMYYTTFVISITLSNYYVLLESAEQYLFTFI